MVGAGRPTPPPRCPSPSSMGLALRAWRYNTSCNNWGAYHLPMLALLNSTLIWRQWCIPMSSSLRTFGISCGTTDLVSLISAANYRGAL